ncbi:tetratricopeptide repeat protein [Limnobacter litoralis]|uniref:Tetratricopeptide repeat protein n=1 Tax=Limnobacter litoralis TaxID=481366 RepID=A0ABQ5YT69_9BURK|nr:tetratricopeptide repeat protein [Limnobacter litoralis]GLR26565.1 hypothetical protein GCM10007875_16550 [Limnobacter litoralis]
MKKSALFSTLFALLIMATGLACAASEPTIKEVYQAAESGHLSQAQSMMDIVLKNHPNSAKAHFVESELSAKQGDLARARVEFGRAKALEPSMGFAKPEAVVALETQLQGPTGPAASSSSLTHRTGLPWGLWLAIALFAISLIAFMRNRNRPDPALAQIPGNFPTSGGFGYANPPVGPQGGGGSGLLGSLATGAAMGAGVVAGEALMNRILDGHQSGNGQALNSLATIPNESKANYDMGGNDFGLQDDSSWNDNNFDDTSNDDSWN